VRLQACAMSFGLFLEDLFDWRDAQVRVQGVICYIPWGVGDSSESHRLVALDNSNVGGCSTVP
jgi:hypothetical protein